MLVQTVEEALRDADAAVIATEWPAYRDLDWAALRVTMRRPGRQPSHIGLVQAILP